MSQRNAALLSFVVIVGAGCPLDLSVSGETIILCDDNADCPAPRVCATRVGRCVDASRIDAPAIAITSVDVERTRMSSIAPFDDNLVTVKTAFAPRTLEVRFADAALDCVTDDDDSSVARCAFTVPDVAVDTDVAVVVNASDDLGNVATASVGVVVDVTAPALLPATVVSRYLGASDNPRLLDGLVAARAGTVVEVGLAFNEPCAALPEVNGQLLDSEDLAFDNDDDIALPAVAFFVHRTIDSSDENGRYGIAASCIDAVGNSAAVVVDDLFVVDNAAPAAVDIEVAEGDAGSVTLLRAPWGRAVDGVFVGAHARVVRGATSTDEPTLRVDVYGPALLGSGAQEADGAFDIPLLVGDVRVVEVQLVDGAGNVSARRAVRNVEWTATLGSKIVGSLFENPHAVSTTPTLRTTLSDPELREVDPAATLAVDAVEIGATTGLRWREVELGDAVRPQGRTESAAAFNPATGLITMAGGSAVLIQQPETATWSIDGRRWRALPAAAPAALVGRSSHGVQDLQRDRFVVVTAAADVFEFDGNNWRQTTSLPTNPDGGVFGYDAIAGRAIWHGGVDDGVRHARTWSFDGRVWRELAGTAPTVQDGPAFGWDDTLNGLVRFGAGETWLFADDVWQRLEVAPPSNLPDPQFASDPDGGLLLLMSTGDEKSTLARFADGEWSEVDVEGEAPAHLVGTTWVGDPSSGDVIRFGGLPFEISTFDRASNLTLRFDGRRWRTEQPTPSVPPLVGAAAATDHLGNVVLFGGSFDGGPGGAVGVTQSISIFDRDTGARSSVDLGEGFPGGHVAVARRGTELVVIESNVAGRVTTWNPVTRAITTSVGAPAVGNGVMATLDDSTVLLIGGGATSRQTWSYDGVAWTLVCDGSADGIICPAASAAAGFRDGLVVAWNESSTSLFSDGVWSTMTAPQPTGISGARLAKHVGRDSLVLFGGTSGWEFRCPSPCTADDARWFELTTLTTPPSHTSHTLSAFGDSVFLVTGSPLGDSWFLDAGDDARPAVQARFSIGAAGLAGELQSITVDATARAAGPGATAVALLAWQRGAFQTVATAATDGALSWTTDRPQDAIDSLFGSAQDVVLAVTSAGGGVRDGVATSVDLDAIELRVRYRLPAP